MVQFQVRQKLFAHRQDGDIGSFTAADQWSSLGRIQGASQTLYGFRVQRAGRGLSMGFNGSLQSTTPTLGTPFIEWGGNSGISVTPGDLQFRSFTSPTSAAPVIRYTIRGADGTGLFGATSSGIFTTPFFEINGATATGLGVNNTNFSASAVYGVKSFCAGTTAAYGVYGNANTANSSFGVYGLADSDNDNYGVYGSVAGGNSNTAGYFAGPVITTYGFYNISDRKFKTEIVAEEGMLAKLKKLNPVNYFFKKDDAFKQFSLDTKYQHGFIADEVESVFPEMIQTVKQPIFENGNVVRKEEFKSVNYTMLIPMLTKAIQELSDKVDSLENLLVNKQAATVVVNQSTLSVTEKLALDNKTYSLSQNTPNPFSAATIISYAVPDNTINAAIAIFDLNGKLLQQYSNLKGNSKLTINANTLPAGIYIYSLLANGQEVISKRMVLTK